MVLLRFVMEFLWLGKKGCISGREAKDEELYKKGQKLTSKIRSGCI